MLRKCNANENCVAFQQSDCQDNANAPIFALCVSNPIVYQKNTNSCVYEKRKIGNTPSMFFIMILIEILYKEKIKLEINTYYVY